MLAREQQRKGLHYVLLAVSVLLLYLMIAAFDDGQFMQYVGQLDIAYLTGFVAIFTVTWLLRALRLTCLVPETIGMVRSLKIQLAGAAVNLILPLKAGDFLTARYLQKETHTPYSQALGYTLQMRVLDFIILLWMVASVFVQWKFIDSWLLTLFLVSGALLALMSLVARFSGLMKLKIQPARRFFRFLVNTYNQVLGLQKLTVPYLLAFLLSMGIWMLEVLAGYWLIYQLGFDISFASLALCMAFANLCKALPLLPGGLGTYEAGFLLVGTMLGIPVDQLVTLSIVDHLLKKLYNIIAGFPVYLISLKGLIDDDTEKGS